MRHQTQRQNDRNQRWSIHMKKKKKKLTNSNQELGISEHCPNQQLYLHCPALSAMDQEGKWTSLLLLSTRSCALAFSSPSLAFKTHLGMEFQCPYWASFSGIAIFVQTGMEALDPTLQHQTHNSLYYQPTNSLRKNTLATATTTVVVLLLLLRKTITCLKWKAKF